MIRYYVHYQRAVSDARSSVVGGDRFQFDGTDENGLALVPNAGDYVFIPGRLVAFH